MEYCSNGVRLFYLALGAEESEAAPVVVLLHPTPVDHQFWLPVATQLAGRFRVLLPDLRGHGASEAGPDAVITVHTLAADIVAMLDDAGVVKAHFVGCSIGAYVLYEVWRIAPARILSLAFCCGKPHGDTDAMRRKRLANIADVEQSGSADFVNAMLATLVSPATREGHPRQMIALRAMTEGMQQKAFVAMQRGLADRSDALSLASTIRVRCLVLAAEYDVLSTPGEMQQLADILPHSEFHLLHDAGHYAPFEQPEQVSRLLFHFLRQEPA